MVSLSNHSGTYEGNHALLLTSALSEGSTLHLFDDVLPSIYNSLQNRLRHQKDGIMENVSKELISAVNPFYQKYKNLDNEITSKRPAADKWTLKEIIGHLIDSASNNHQRFVRLQIVDELIFPGYGKDNSKWLEIQKYNDMNFSDIMLLWKQYNVLIGNIIKVADESKLENRWINSEGDKKALKDLMTDYLRHLKDHLRHFEETLQEIKR
jgi:hypothetical protein